MVQVWAEPLCKRHYAGLLSFAFFLRVAVHLGIIALSLVIAFATGGFWVKVKPSLDQPHVHYTNDALIVFEGQQAGQERVWSTSPAIMSTLSDYAVAASVQVGEEDINYDGKPDVIEFSARIQSDIPVYAVRALLQFSYFFDSNVRLKMYGLAYLSEAWPVSGGVLHTDGNLLLQQKTPITDRKYNGIYDSPILSSNSSAFAQAVQGSTNLDFESILKSYLDRNYTTVYSNYHPVWKPSVGAGFTLKMRVRIPPNQVVWYRPQVIEELKFGWIQFLVTWVPLWFILYWCQWFVFRFRLVVTRVKSDVQPKPQVY